MNDQPHILVADDNATLVQVLRLRLQAAGMRVSTASDGFEAVRVLLEQHIDLVIADYQMPGVDGESLLAALRGHERSRKLPAILITGQGYDLDAQRLKVLYDLSAVFFKPISTNEIIGAVRKALAAPGARDVEPTQDVLVG